MIYYKNGHIYGFDFRFYLSSISKSPLIKVEIFSKSSGRFVPVVGKIDTGATNSVLDFDTARILGIKNPKKDYLSVKTYYTASDQPLTCYVHQVMARLTNREGLEYQFTIRPGFGAKIARNLFGMDWTWHFCLALDRQEVHLLRD